MSEHQFVIDCLHVDDEMGVRADLRFQMLAALLGEGCGDRFGEPVPQGAGVVGYAPVPVPRDHLAGLPQEVEVVFRLTQVKDFKRAATLIDRSFYHMVVADVMWLGAGGERVLDDPFSPTFLDEFLDYSGCQLLRAIPWEATRRLIYSRIYPTLHSSHNIDLVASRLNSYVAALPDGDVHLARFRERIRIMVAESYHHSAFDGSRFWLECVGLQPDLMHIGFRLYERTPEGFRTLLADKGLWLIRVGSAEDRFPAPGHAEYAVLLWLLGYSRRLFATGEFAPRPPVAASLGSWRYAMGQAYNRLLEARDTTRFPTEADFSAFISAADGPWPHAAGWLAGQGGLEVAPVRMNVLNFLLRVRQTWMPVRGGETLLMTHPILRPIRPFLPRDRNGCELFPINLTTTIHN